MAENLPKPFAQARARIEAERAKAELWFTEAGKEAKTEKEKDEALVDYVFHRFMAFAQETYNASIEMDSPMAAAELRDAIEGALSTIIDQTFRSKHYCRNIPDQPFDNIGSKARFTELTANEVFSSDEWHQIQEKLKELAEWQAENSTERTPSLIGRLPKDALVRMEAATAAFMADYLPKLEREANKSGSVHDAELLRELVIHQYNLVARECMAVCESVEEFEGELRSDIARFVRYGLTQYRWLADPMREELDQGFTLFVMSMNPWAEIPEEDRATAWHVGAFTGEALSHAALRLRAEAWKHAAEGGFPEAKQADVTERSRDEPTRAEAGSAVNGPDGNGADRRAAVDAYIEEVSSRTGKRITRTDIWKSARYKSRTEFERWERNDLEHPNKTANQRFTRILTEKPHLK
jgi:hypothetical protein